MLRSIPPTPCPVCLSRETREFFRQRNVPTQAGYLAPTQLAASNCELGDILLQHCRTCGHIWNRAYDPAKLHFDAEYTFSQYHSSLYCEYAKGSINRLKKRYGLEGKTAIDIGCGKGDWMKLMLEHGLGRAVGFDPSYEPRDFGPQLQERVTAHKKYYDERDMGIDAELVTCRGVLQYVPQPRDMISSIRRTIGNRHDTTVCFDVANSAEMLEKKAVWFVMYETSCLFSDSSLARLFSECGFQVMDLVPGLGTSLLEIEARPSDAPRPHAVQSSTRIAQIDAAVDEFESLYRSRVREWSDRFEDYRREGKRVALWCAGMRAISFMEGVPLAAECIEAVVDVNPIRSGRFMPKTGKPVVSPEQLTNFRPDIVIATNPNYAEEIKAQVRGLGLSCDYEVLA